MKVRRCGGGGVAAEGRARTYFRTGPQTRAPLWLGSLTPVTRKARRFEDLRRMPILATSNPGVGDPSYNNLSKVRSGATEGSGSDEVGVTTLDGSATPSGVGAPGYSTADASASRRWKCVCAYDGTSFEGWQSQVGGRAIQDVIETALAALLGRSLRIHASGRTDAGVHAHGQVFHFDAPWKHGPEKLRAALRSKLPPTLQIKSICEVAPDFHARFSATGKIYHYDLLLEEADPFTRPYVWAIERPLDLEAMAAAVAVLQGSHDFRAFSALNGPPKEDTVRDLRRFDLVKQGPRVQLQAEADGFMYKMVRSLVGAVVGVGEGRLTVERLSELLRSGKRIPLIATAPPQGLFLVKVLYP